MDHCAINVPATRHICWITACVRYVGPSSRKSRWCAGVHHAQPNYSDAAMTEVSGVYIKKLRDHQKTISYKEYHKMSEESVYSKATEYSAWCKANGTKPRRHSSDAAESRLAGWFNSYKQRVNCSGAVNRIEYDKVTNVLKDALGNGIFDDRHTKCMAMAMKYVRFCNLTGRRPSAVKGLIREEELANWYYKYRAACAGTVRRTSYQDVTKYMADNLKSA